MTLAYRSAYEHIVGTRIAELQLAREMVEPLMPELHAIGRARLARAIAGGVGVAGACVMVVLAATTNDGSPTYALLGAVFAMIATYAIARAVLATLSRLDRGDVAPPRLTGQVVTDLAALDSTLPHRRVAQRLARLELWSTALPMAAVSLLAPLTLHFLFLQLVSQPSATSFASWIRISLVIVGHAHLALVALTVSFARHMKKSADEAVTATRITREWVKAWGITVGVAAVPGIALLLVPPVLAAVTGIVFIPFLFLFVWRRVVTERAAIERAHLAAEVEGDQPARLTIATLSAGRSSVSTSPSAIFVS